MVLLALSIIASSLVTPRMPASSAVALTTPPPLTRRAALTVGGAALLLPRTASAAVSGEREVSPSIDVVIKKGNPPVTVSKSRYTGVGDPAWSYQQRDVSSLIYPADSFPASYPFTDKDDFKRLDEQDDNEFYKFPKLVYHIDEGSVSALTRYYDTSIPEGSDVLDICSSWVSHYPRDFPKRMKSIAATGISEIELKCNDQLTGGFKPADLNAKPKLPYADGSFDAVTCVVSFDYLTKPLDVMREAVRVLRPGGQLILSQSNRCFYTKAVGVWTRDMSDPAHLRVLGTYVHFAGGLSEPRAFDISPKGPGTNDPMYIVTAKKV